MISLFFVDQSIIVNQNKNILKYPSDLVGKLATIQGFQQKKYMPGGSSRHLNEVGYVSVL